MAPLQPELESELAAYDYELPRQLIAQYPLARRADARMLVVERRSGRLLHRRIRDLPELIGPADCLVLNDSRVVPARLIGKRTMTGGNWEGLFLEEPTPGLWKILARSRGKPQPHESVTLRDLQGGFGLVLRLLERQAEGIWLVSPDSSEPTLTLLDHFGRVPLPPYIRGGQMLPGDRHRYQTVFAEHPGSAAAPTAGLHFTESLLGTLSAQGTRIARVTLHVGRDTFRPLAVDRLAKHVMHSEWCQIGESAVAAIEACRKVRGRVVAVGTTSMRVMESVARGGELTAWSGRTDLFIRPPFEFRVADALLTNFHLPRSSLLVLVRTFGGDSLIRRAYSEAIREQYRFYSYGDAMLIL